MKVDIYNTNKKYNVIYADPPWGYRNSPSKKGTTRCFAKNHYDLMTTKDICEMPINNLTEDNGVLFMWATLPMIQDALNVIEAWGFNYRTCAFVWVKKNKKATDTNFWGCGYYTRSNAEICLLATKGKILERKTHSIHQIIESSIECHSKKPDIVREKIVELFGDLPRIELFARETKEGWDCFGNEV